MTCISKFRKISILLILSSLLVGGALALSIGEKNVDSGTVATTAEMVEDYNYTIQGSYNMSASCGGTSKFRYRVIGSEGGKSSWKTIATVTDDGDCGGWGGGGSTTYKAGNFQIKPTVAEEEEIQLHYNPSNSGDGITVKDVSSSKDKLPPSSGTSYVEEVEKTKIETSSASYCNDPGWDPDGIEGVTCKKDMIIAEALADETKVRVKGNYTLFACADMYGGAKADIRYNKEGTRGGETSETTIDTTGWAYGDSAGGWSCGDDQRTEKGGYSVSMVLNEGEKLNIIGFADEDGSDYASVTLSNSTKVVGNADSKPPTTTDNYDGLWHNTSQTVQLSCSDNPSDGSGCDTTYYCVDQANSCTPNNEGNKVTISKDGVNYLRYYSTDNAGNQENTQSTEIKIDRTEPDVFVNKDESGDTVEAQVKCTDQNSGCQTGTEKMKIYEPGNQPDQCPESYDTYEVDQKSRAIGNTAYVCGTAKDKAGHTSYSSQPVKFEGSSLTAQILYPTNRVVTSVNREPHVFYQITNLGDTNRNIDLELQGINSDFHPEGKETETIGLSAQGQQQHEIAIKPQQTGTENLTVKAYSQNANLLDTIAVEVPTNYSSSTGEDSESIRKVPGIGTTQIMALVLLAAGAYSFIVFDF